ncbi:DUF6387 family protein [Methylobacter sp.]|uniref:DUF6387 family protein n=1 Tax=Methylobacter sp. TaxID=2051955 RepID=UPI003DA4E2FA
MTEELDTSWFDLKNYEVLKTLSIDEWAEVLSTRYHNYDSLIELDRPWRLGKLPNSFLLARATRVKKGIVINDKKNDAHLTYKVESILKGNSFSTVSVNSLSSYELAQLAVDNNLSQVWEACKHMRELEANLYDNDSDLIPNTNLTDIALTPHDDNIRQHLDTSYPLAYVAIDLYATDEQIKEDFNHWLTNYRREVKHQSPKRLFKQADFDRWIRYSVIPYLDLTFIAKIEGKTITQNKMAHMIFPEEYEVDIVGRLRQVTIPMAEKLIGNKTHEALSAQSVFEKTIRKS